MIIGLHGIGGSTIEDVRAALSHAIYSKDVLHVNKSNDIFQVELNSQEVLE